jgi:hypothetical protein
MAQASLWWFGLNIKEGWESFGITFDIVISFAKERSYATWWRHTLWKSMVFDKSSCCKDLPILWPDLPAFRFPVSYRRIPASTSLFNEQILYRPASFHKAVDVSLRDAGQFQYHLVELEVTKCTNRVACSDTEIMNIIDTHLWLLKI